MQVVQEVDFVHVMGCSSSTSTLCTAVDRTVLETSHGASHRHVTEVFPKPFGAGACEEPVCVAEPQQRPDGVHPPRGALPQHQAVVLRGARYPILFAFHKSPFPCFLLTRVCSSGTQHAQQATQTAASRLGDCNIVADNAVSRTDAKPASVSVCLLSHSCQGPVLFQCTQHFHLSHNYADSISVVGGCAFVQVGVIGDCNRDGHRHSRLLKGLAALPPPCLLPSTSLVLTAPRLLPLPQPVQRPTSFAPHVRSQIDCPSSSFETRT